MIDCLLLQLSLYKENLCNNNVALFHSRYSGAALCETFRTQLRLRPWLLCLHVFKVFWVSEGNTNITECLVEFPLDG